MIHFLFLACLFALGSAEQCEADLYPLSEGDCRRFEDPGTIAQCAGSQYRSTAISGDEFKTLLFYAMSKVPSHTTLYSVGVAYGQHAGLAIGSQSNFAFTSGGIYDLDPRRIRSSPVTLTLRHTYKRTVLLFTPTSLPESDLPWSFSVFVSASPLGDFSSMFSHPRANVAKKLVHGCSAYDAWRERYIYTDRAGYVIHMPLDMWCPHTAENDFDVVVAGFRKTEILVRGSPEEVYVSEWERNSKISYGNVPTLYKELDFQ